MFIKNIFFYFLKCFSLQNRDSSIQPITSQAMLSHIPCSDQAKLDVKEVMLQHRNTIFTDLSVHMLMATLVMFDSQDCDATVRRVHEAGVNMLRGHLQAQSCQPEFDLQVVLRCVKDMPHITATRNKLFVFNKR